MMITPGVFPTLAPKLSGKGTTHSGVMVVDGRSSVQAEASLSSNASCLVSGLPAYGGRISSWLYSLDGNTDCQMEEPCEGHIACQSTCRLCFNEHTEISKDFAKLYRHNGRMTDCSLCDDHLQLLVRDYPKPLKWTLYEYQIAIAGIMRMRSHRAEYGPETLSLLFSRQKTESVASFDQVEVEDLVDWDDEEKYSGGCCIDDTKNILRSQVPIDVDLQLPTLKLKHMRNMARLYRERCRLSAVSQAWVAVRTGELISLSGIKKLVPRKVRAEFMAPLDSLALAEFVDRRRLEAEFLAGVRTALCPLRNCVQTDWTAGYRFGEALNPGPGKKQNTACYTPKPWRKTISRERVATIEEDFWSLADDEVQKVDMLKGGICEKCMRIELLLNEIKIITVATCTHNSVYIFYKNMWFCVDPSKLSNPAFKTSINSLFESRRAPKRKSQYRKMEGSGQTGAVPTVSTATDGSSSSGFQPPKSSEEKKQSDTVPAASQAADDSSSSSGTTSHLTDGQRALMNSDFFLFPQEVSLPKTRSDTSPPSCDHSSLLCMAEAARRLHYCSVGPDNIDIPNPPLFDYESEKIDPIDSGVNWGLNQVRLEELVDSEMEWLGMKMEARRFYEELVNSLASLQIRNKFVRTLSRTGSLIRGLSVKIRNLGSSTVAYSGDFEVSTSTTDVLTSSGPYDLLSDDEPSIESTSRTSTYVEFAGRKHLAMNNLKGEITSLMSSQYEKAGIQGDLLVLKITGQDWPNIVYNHGSDPITWFGKNSFLLTILKTKFYQAAVVAAALSSGAKVKCTLRFRKIRLEFSEVPAFLPLQNFITTMLTFVAGRLSEPLGLPGGQFEILFLHNKPVDFQTYEATSKKQVDIDSEYYVSHVNIDDVEVKVGLAGKKIQCVKEKIVTVPVMKSDIILDKKLIQPIATSYAIRRSYNFMHETESNLVAMNSTEYWDYVSVGVPTTFHTITTVIQSYPLGTYTVGNELNFVISESDVGISIVFNEPRVRPSLSIFRLRFNWEIIKNSLVKLTTENFRLCRVVPVTARPQEFVITLEPPVDMVPRRDLTRAEILAFKENEVGQATAKAILMDYCVKQKNGADLYMRISQAWEVKYGLVASRKSTLLAKASKNTSSPFL
jgi:hypothetical protein